MFKKCYFETYRFSGDLDFTVPTNQNISIKKINPTNTKHIAHKKFEYKNLGAPKVKNILDAIDLATPPPDPIKSTDHIAPRRFFPIYGHRTPATLVMDTIRHAAHNRQCVLISHHNHDRLIEPYSLRYPETGNELLYVRELEKDGLPSSKSQLPVAYKTREIEKATISGRTYKPKWKVEL